MTDRRWRFLAVHGARGMAAVADQGLVSGSSLALSLLLARWMPAAEFGAFALAFSIFLVIAGFHNALVLEPMSVLGPARHRDRLDDYFAAQTRVHVAATAIATAAVLAATLVAWLMAPALAPALLGIAIAVPTVLLFWLARRQAYVAARPDAALAGSLVFAVVLAAALGGIWWTRTASTLAGMAALGLASLAGAGVLMARPRQPVVDRGAGASGPSARDVWRDDLAFGRWAIGSAILYPLATQIQLFVLGGALGLASAGALRAMQVLTMPMVQLLTAFGTLALPRFAALHGEGRAGALHRRGSQLAFAFAFASAAYALALIAWRDPIVLAVYGGRFASEVSLLIPLAGALPLIALASVFAILLRALQQPRLVLWGDIAAAVAGVAGSILLTARWSAFGAASSVVLAFGVQAGVLAVLYARSSQATRPTPAADAALSNDHSLSPFARAAG